MSGRGSCGRLWTRTKSAEIGKVLVYVKRIDMRGFKTFGRKVSLNLDRGLTVITGPNGSGKSNILDSVKFALGELSPKELRGGTISDLIHKGSPAAARSAYVAVQFENADRRIPVDSDAVTISREFRRGGEGIYRLNGRRVARKQLTDILSSADIQVAGHNIVPQHAVTRLAEITPEERRKIIEDMIGIAVYDAKKAEAQLQLQQADLNLKVASARIDEVRVRVEGLERERNDYLKYVQLKREIGELQAKLISDKIRLLRENITKLSQDIQAKQAQIDSMKRRRDELSKLRSQAEADRRAYEESIVDKGSSELFDVERTIGDTNALIASLKTEISSAEANIRTLERQGAQLLSHLDQLETSAGETRKELRTLGASRERLVKALEEEQRLHEESAQRMSEMRTRLGENTREAQMLEAHIDEFTKRLIRLNASIKGSSTRVELVESHIRTLQNRKQEYLSLIDEVKSRQEEVSRLAADEQARLQDVERRLSEYSKLGEQRQKELQHATDVSRKARLTFVEFETQKNLAESIASEEKALQLIEEMGKAGAIQGVFGRLRDLVKFSDEHRKAIDAASAGWMKSIVVKNIDTALGCIESLKRTKLGRIKLIPLENVTFAKSVEPPKGVPGILGGLSDFVKSAERYRPAVNYVFGDTVLASGQRSAFLASLEGARAVSVTGDLYEPGGGMEIGYYREPLDLSTVIPKESALKSLGATVESLEKLVERGMRDIERLREEVLHLTESRAMSQHLVEAMEKERNAIAENLSRAESAVALTKKRLEKLNKQVESEKALLATASASKADIHAKLDRLIKDRAALRLKAKSATLIEAESKHSALTDELNALVQQKVEVESKVAALDSSLKTLLPSLEQARIQHKAIQSQIAKVKASCEDARAKLVEADKRLRELHARREELSGQLTSVRAKRSEFEQELKKLDSELMKTLDELEPLNSQLAELTSTTREKEMQATFQMGQLRELGYQEPLDVQPEEIEKAESALATMRRELEAIGAVNQLAVTQYEEQKSNYQQLSGRINELEKEKLSIVEFMNELDRKKHETFMKAFNQVGDTFHEIFSKITGGGVGKLILEFPEEPFRGGVDIFLQFPGKAEMTIGSASGGEKSVGTVCFIFALQAIHPMPFYMMDEVDAHLDVVNSQRLADLLNERAKGSQFVVISLKDITISRADKVYGVFVQEGVSQIVSLPMPEARA